MTDTPDDLPHRIADLTGSVRHLASMATPPISDIPTIIAVSKRQPDERIETALKAGHRIYGENQVQEAVARWSDRRRHHPDITLHLIGPLQSNKAADAVALFDVIHTVDRDKIARAIKEESVRQGRNPFCLVQVNLADELQKSGVSVKNLPALLDYCRSIHLSISGLMCIPPEQGDPSTYFAQLRQLANQHGLKALSMGMSNDYPAAIANGATYLRIGTGFFGNRIHVEHVGFLGLRP